jgi:hypothetical protein
MLKEFQALELRFEEPTRKLIAFCMSGFNYLQMTMYQGEGFAEYGKYEGMSI